MFITKLDQTVETMHVSFVYAMDNKALGDMVEDECGARVIQSEITPRKRLRVTAKVTDAAKFRNYVKECRALQVELGVPEEVLENCTWVSAMSEDGQVTIITSDVLTHMMLEDSI